MMEIMIVIGNKQYGNVGNIDNNNTDNAYDDVDNNNSDMNKDNSHRHSNNWYYNNKKIVMTQQVIRIIMIKTMM